jgi:hypothetical protein
MHEQFSNKRGAERGQPARKIECRSKLAERMNNS